MATFYIDPTAASGGDGSLATPFQAWASVTWTAGNTYLQKRGTTTTATITPGVTGTVNARITIGAYGSSADWPYAILNATGLTKGITFSTSSIGFITIQDFDIYGSDNNGAICSTTSSKSSGIIVQRCFIHAIPNNASTDNDGIVIYGTDLIIRDCIITDIADDAIWLTLSGQTLIENCKIYTIGRNTTRLTGDGIQVGPNWTGQITIRNCEIWNDNDKHCIIVGSPTTPGTGIVNIVNCKLRGGVHVINIDDVASCNILRCHLVGGIYDEAASPHSLIFNQMVTGGTMLVQGCMMNCANNVPLGIYQYPGGASVTTTVRNCTFRNNSFRAFSAFLTIGTAGTMTAKNCIFDTKLTTGFSTATGGVGMTFVFTNCHFIKEAASFIVSNNVGYATVAAAAAAGVCVNCTTGAITWETPGPTLRSGSALIAGGVSYGPAVDVDGKQFLNPPSVGAYEYAYVRGVR